MGILLLVVQSIFLIATFFFINSISKEKDLKALSKKRSYGVILMTLSYVVLLINLLNSGEIFTSINFVYVLSFFGLISSLFLIFLQNMKELDFKYKRDLENLESKKSKKGDSI